MLPNNKTDHKPSVDEKFLVSSDDAVISAILEADLNEDLDKFNDLYYDKVKGLTSWDVKYRSNLIEMHTMGFTDFEENMIALAKNNNDLSVVLN